jgi:hypothetical protein
MVMGFGNFIKSFVSKVAVGVVAGICTGGVGIAAIAMQAAIQTAAETAIQRAAKLVKKLGMPPEIAGAIGGFAQAVMSGGAGTAASISKFASSGSAATLTNAVGRTATHIAGKALPKFADGLAAQAGTFAQEQAQNAIDDAAKRLADKVAKKATKVADDVAEMTASLARKA